MTIMFPHVHGNDHSCRNINPRCMEPKVATADHFSCWGTQVLKHAERPTPSRWSHLLWCQRGARPTKMSGLELECHINQITQRRYHVTAIQQRMCGRSREVGNTLVSFLSVNVVF